MAPVARVLTRKKKLLQPQLPLLLTRHQLFNKEAVGSPPAGPKASVSTAGAEGGAAPVVAGTPAQEIAIIGTFQEEARSVKKCGRNTKRAKHQAGLGVNYGVPPLRTQCFRKLGPCSVADRASGGKRGGPQKSEVEKGGKRAEGQKAMEGKQGGIVLL